MDGLTTSRAGWHADRGRLASPRAIAVALWLVVFAASVAIAIRTAGSYYRDLVDLADFQPNHRAEIRTSLARVHLSTTGFAIFELGMSVLQSVIPLVVSILLVWKARIDWFVVLVAVSLVAQAQATYPPDAETLFDHSRPWIFLARCVTLVGIGGFFLFPILFPNGRLVPRWMGIAAAYVIYGAVSFIFWPSWDPITGTIGVAIQAASTLALLAAIVSAQVYRYRRVSSVVERQQMKWVVFGLCIGLPGFFLGDAMMRLFRNGAGGVLTGLALTVVLAVAFSVIPMTIGIAILRFHLYDIDLVIGRTAVWAAMTAGVVAAYVLVVLGIGSLLNLEHNLVLSLVATGIVAVGFQPARARVQRGVNRLLFGDRDDPYAVISRLGQRLEAALATDEVLPAIVRTLTEALRLPYAAIYLGGSTTTLAAAAGTPSDHAVRFPLTYQSRPVGELVVAPRAAGEQFGPSDRRLLEDLARQVGVAAHSVTLATDLQRSRERIISAREEERRRLRRDLHDGLGAQLAALSIQAGALRGTIATDPVTATEQAGELRAELRAAVADIRRLVHGLRPPALDELGLVAALRERATRYGAGGVFQDGGKTRIGQDGLAVTFTAPDPFPSLPAATEVALYRITDEALTNVARHAGARECAVILALESGSVVLTVEDDGAGIPPAHPAGVGLRSMRERAEELGGTMAIGPGSDGQGTRLEVRLPCPGEEIAQP